MAVIIDGGSANTEDKATKVAGATAGNLASLTSGGDLADSGAAAANVPTGDEKAWLTAGEAGGALGSAAYAATGDFDAAGSAAAALTAANDYTDTAVSGVASDVGDLTTAGLTAANMLRVAAAGGLEERTPAQVLSDIGITASADNINSLITGKWKMWACAIRSNAGTWEILDNADHTPINVASISQDSGKVDLTLSFTASKVITALAVPDEIYAGKFNFGVSMGVSTASVYFRRMTVGGVPCWICTNNLSTTPYFTVSSFQGGAAAPKTVAWSAGVLTITHADAQPVQGVPAFSNMGFDVVNLMAVNTFSYTSTAIKFYTPAGVQLLDPSTGGGRDFPASYRFVFERVENSLGYATLNPNSAELQLSNSNVWLFGISEVA